MGLWDFDESRVESKELIEVGIQSQDKEMIFNCYIENTQT
jgi:hypothetical protein